MKRNLLLALGFTAFLLIKTSSSFSQTISIDSARSLTAGFTANQTGGTVTVAGIATNGQEFGNLRYMQDGTGGISAYGALVATVNKGDSILVTGTLSNYNSLIEIEVTSVTIVSTGNPLPAPIVFSASEISSAFAEAYESQLVQVNGVTSITSAKGAAVTTFAGNTGYDIDGVYAEEVYIKNGSTGANGIVGASVPTGTFDVIGIMSQYSSTNTATGYELTPRLYNDFILSGAPNINSVISVTNITTTSLTLNFTTINSGDTKILYGTTTAFGDSIYSSASVTSHTATLTGLSPSTVYYITAISTNSIGASTSNVVTLITASNSTGKITVYFNNKDVDARFAWPGNTATYLYESIDDTVVSYLNRAKYTIDIAMYDWNNSGLANMTAAADAAHARGVVVRFIGDGSTGNSGGYDLNSSIGKIFSPTTAAYGIMHNKFMIIDANSTNPNDALVWTGSTNWTYEQIEGDNNNVIIIQDQSLAIAYTMEFNQMFGSSGPQPNATASKFGPYKSDITPHYFNIAGIPIQSYFSPSDGVTSKIINTINSANHDFEIATMLITRSDIISAVDSKFSTLADTCSGAILDDTSSNDDAPDYLSIQSVLHDRIRMNPGPDIMHNKYVVIDEGDTTSDPTVLTGSHNWSTAAETKNDENTLIVHQAKISNTYYQNFAAIFEDFKGSVCNYYCPVMAVVTAGPNQSVCAGISFVNITGSVTNASGGRWTTSGTGSFSPNDSTINASYAPSVADNAKGSVTLTLTATGASAPSCGPVTAQTKILISNCGATGITSGSSTDDGIYIYPNPTSSGFQLYSGNASVASMQLLDSKGTVVSANSSDVSATQNVSNLAEGLYFVKITFSDNSMAVKKIVISR